MPHRPHENICAWERALPSSLLTVLDWTRPIPVVEFGDDIIDPEFAVGNDSPPCMLSSLLSKRAVKLHQLFHC